MKLREARVLFSTLLAQLPQEASRLGYDLAFDEVKRPQALADLYAAQGVGVRNSAHVNGLAVDVLLYKDGVYLTGAEGYDTLGTFWKSLHPLCRWGGDFKSGVKKDYGHYSLEFGGVQ